MHKPPSLLAIFWPTGLELTETLIFITVRRSPVLMENRCIILQV